MGVEDKIRKWKLGQKAYFSKTISESDVYLFAGITGDFNPMHINKEVAESSTFEERIVHGILVVGLVSAAIGTKLPGEGTIYLEQDARFLMPVKIGDTITAIIEIAEILNLDKGILKLNTEAVNQRNNKVLNGYAIVKASI